MDSLLKLIQLTSPALPIGSYAYSQGLESAVNESWVHDETSTENWVGGLLRNSLTYLDGPVFARLYKGWENNDESRVQYWNDYLFSCRETMELREEERQLGVSLAKLLGNLDIHESRSWESCSTACFLTLFSLASVRWKIPAKEALAGFLWLWSENQVVAAIKLVPLGQTQGQKMLKRIGAIIPGLVDRALDMKDDEIGFTAPGQVLASVLHETQYSRLFRS